MEGEHSAWEKEMAILRTERAMIRVMCGVMLLDQRNSKELMYVLSIKQSLDRIAKASSMRWYGYVLRKENVIVKGLKFEVSGSRGRPKQTWKKQAENEMKTNGLVKEDACNRTKWRGVVKTITIRNPASSVDNIGSNMKWWCICDCLCMIWIGRSR